MSNDIELALLIITEKYKQLSKIDQKLFLEFLPDVFVEDRTVSDTALKTVLQIIRIYSKG